MIRLLAAALLAALLAANSSAMANPFCRTSAKLVGQCFTVRGRLSAANGTPTFRIWPVASKRILGVEAIDGENETTVLPPNLKAVMSRPKSDPFQTYVYGDYRVCPLAKARRGHMQFVCIEKASNLNAKPR